jgi:hypothetical protein
MKYKYIAGLLVALSFNSGFAAEAVIGPDSYQEIYSAFHRGGVVNINVALKNNEGFNHNNDVDTIRRSAAGFALRTAVIGLNAAELQTVVEKNHEFFKTSLGVSLVYGWALNHFKDAITPYYIGHYFSFGKMFQGLADSVAGDVNVRTFLKSAFTRGLRAVEDDRWAFYDHMLYLPYAIEKVRAIEQVVEAAPSMDGVIAGARRTKAEAQTEAANLVPAKAGRTVHLDVVANTEDDTKSGCADLAEAQEYILLRPDLFGDRTPEQETFLSLPAGTPETYEFMGRSVAAHMAVFKAIDRGVHGGGHDGEHEAVDLNRAKYLDNPAKNLKMLTDTVLGYVDVRTIKEFERVMKVACETELADEFPKDVLDRLLAIEAEDIELGTCMAAACGKTIGVLAVELLEAMKRQRDVLEHERQEAERRIAIEAAKQAVDDYNIDRQTAFASFSGERPKNMVLPAAEIVSLRRIIRNRNLSLKESSNKHLQEIFAGQVVTGKGGGLNDRGTLLQKIIQWLDAHKYDGSTPYPAH